MVQTISHSAETHQQEKSFPKQQSAEAHAFQHTSSDNNQFPEHILLLEEVEANNHKYIS